MVAKKEKDKNKDIRELVEVLEQLTPLQLMLVQNSAKTLQSYEQITKQNREQELVQQRR